MRIDRIRIDGFGRLRGWDTGAQPLDSLVVVLGPNEAGKSTLFAFLTTALYGFQPASRERNPHVPWGADEAAGRVRLRLDGGSCADVERRLRSQPTACLIVDGQSTDLRNQPLPWVEHVPRTVFRQVFAITLTELAGLDEETWARIQDRVVGSMGATDLRSARVVADELEREAGELWRPNRRGHQRLRELQAELRALRARRAAAHERDTRIRALIEEREQTLVRLRQVRAARERDRLAAERVQSLLPVKRQLARIASLRAEGGDPAELSGLPADPPARWAELEAERGRLRAREETLGALLAEHAGTSAAFGARPRALLARREDVQRLLVRTHESAPDRARASELEFEISRLESRLDAVGAELLARPWREVSERAVLELPLDALRVAVARAATPPPPATTAAPGPAVWGALGVGAALLVWGARTSSVLASAAGAGLAGMGAAAWVVKARAAARAAAATESLQGPAEPAALLEDVPVRSALLETPGPQLLSGLERLQTLLREHQQALREREAARARIAEVDAEARALADTLGAGPAADARTVAPALDAELREAERAQHAAAVAEREAGRLGGEREQVRAARSEVETELEALERRARALGDGDVRKGLEAASARLAALRRAAELRDELERSQPDLDEIEPRLAAEDAAQRGSSSDEEVAAARARIAAHEEEIERLVQHAEALEREAAHRRELETVDAVDGEAAALRELEERLVRERDRKWVLAQLLREADRRFREEHQSDLVRRAGAYLEHLTGGRYRRLVVDETSDAHLFRLVGPGLPAPLPLAPPVSTGTLEQAYLSLRLAIVDHLDQGGERLPLFVDEVFVNWDKERQARGLEVLADVARARQVFVFTCNPGVADALARRGARILRMRRDA